MTRKNTTPTKHDSAHPHLTDAVYRHPAFGCAVLTQWNSNVPMRLFGSDLGHHTGITLRFYAAEQHRGLSSDRHVPTEILLEVDLSGAQWARLVSSQGLGSGAPVTITERRTGGFEEVPGIAAPEASKREIHGEEMAAGLRARLAEMRRVAERLTAIVEGPGVVSKNELRALSKDLARHVEQVPGSVQFVYDQFAEATEQVVEGAKAEVEAHVAGVATRLGLENLRDLAPRLLAGPRRP